MNLSRNDRKGSAASSDSAYSLVAALGGNFGFPFASGIGNMAIFGCMWKFCLSGGALRVGTIASYLATEVSGSRVK
jgi:hypothetical protein